MTEPDNLTAQPLVFSFSVRSFHAALRLAQIMGTLTLLLGLTVLAGWAFHAPSLKTVLTGYVSMKANAALCFALSGASLLIGYLVRPLAWKRTCSVILALTVILIAAATLIEYAVDRPLGLDELLFKDDPGAAYTSVSGRMAVNTAIAFLFFGAALILLSRGPRGAMAAHGFTLGGLFIALLALVGYLFDAQIFVGSFLGTRMALHTMIGFWVLGIGILCARPKKGLMSSVLANSPGGLIARRLITPAIITPLFFGWIVFQGARPEILRRRVRRIAHRSHQHARHLRPDDAQHHGTQPDRHRAAAAERGAPERRRARSGRAGGLAAQVGIRRQRQPRNPHAHERRPRHDQPPARLAPDAGAA